nr:LysM domain-containing protein [Anaerolineae bacterium]
MKKTWPPLLLSTMSLLIVLGLMTGCYRPAAPDVTPTPAGGAEAVLPEEEMPNLMATAAANATLAAQMAEETPTVEIPTEPALTPTPSPIATPPTPVPTTPAPTMVAPSTGQITHVVQRGENLFRIALRYGTTVEAIANANGIANPARIYAGQVLLIPSPGAQPPAPPAGETTYVVQPGDNLFRIALRYNMSHLYLAQYNGIANPSLIYVGQVLRIPPR